MTVQIVLEGGPFNGMTHEVSPFMVGPDKGMMPHVTFSHKGKRVKYAPVDQFYLGDGAVYQYVEVPE